MICHLIGKSGPISETCRNIRLAVSHSSATAYHHKHPGQWAEDNFIHFLKCIHTLGSTACKTEHYIYPWGTCFRLIILFMANLIQRKEHVLTSYHRLLWALAASSRRSIELHGYAHIRYLRGRFTLGLALNRPRTSHRQTCQRNFWH
jgi:hypothetical protein